MLTKLAKKLGYTFKNLKNLESALTHRSLGKGNNERLEFLGDSILNFVIAAELYHCFPNAKEGELTRMRASLVKEETVAGVARELGIGDFLQLGISEKRSGGHLRSSILSDALEAIIAAIYEDANMDICQERIVAWYAKALVGLEQDGQPLQKDPKTQLQEYLQAAHLPLPEYAIVKQQGAAHEPMFHVTCKISLLKTPMMGIAPNRRKAEQLAAEAVLKAIGVL